MKSFGLRLIANNGSPISLQAGEILAELGGQAALGLVDYGDAGGELLVLSDVGSLDLYGSRQHERDNLAFLRNLARYARERYVWPVSKAAGTQLLQATQSRFAVWLTASHGYATMAPVTVA